MKTLINFQITTYTIQLIHIKTRNHLPRPCMPKKIISTQNKWIFLFKCICK